MGELDGWIALVTGASRRIAEAIDALDRAPRAPTATELDQWRNRLREGGADDRLEDRRTWRLVRDREF
jgi:hypothetical protein